MRVASLIALLVLLSGCFATASLSGFVDPKYRNNFKASKIVVAGAGFSIEEQKVLEETFAKSFEDYEVNVIGGLELYPPTRIYSQEDILSIASNKGADTILIIQATNRGMSKSHVPQKHYPGTSTSYISGYGNFATVHTHHSPGYTEGGYDVYTPAMNVIVSLINTKNAETIWTADGASRGHSRGSVAHLIDGNSIITSVARRSVSELYSSGLITKKQALNVKDSSSK